MDGVYFTIEPESIAREDLNPSKGIIAIQQK